MKRYIVIFSIRGMTYHEGFTYEKNSFEIFSEKEGLDLGNDFKDRLNMYGDGSSYYIYNIFNMTDSKIEFAVKPEFQISIYIDLISKEIYEELCSTFGSDNYWYEDYMKTKIKKTYLIDELPDEWWKRNGITREMYMAAVAEKTHFYPKTITLYE